MNLFRKLTELNVHSLHIIAILKPSPVRSISENLSFRWQALQHTTSSNLVNKMITLIILLLFALVSISTLCTFILEELLSTFDGGWFSPTVFLFPQNSFFLFGVLPYWYFLLGPPGLFSLFFLDITI